MRLRELGFHWYLLVIPTVCYLVAAFISHSNVGERHLLPLYPFLFVLTAAVLLSQPLPDRRVFAMAAAGLLLIVETCDGLSSLLAFFNVLAGGPPGGRHYLVDSNVDLGQDLKNLKK